VLDYVQDGGTHTEKLWRCFLSCKLLAKAASYQTSECSNTPRRISIYTHKFSSLPAVVALSQDVCCSEPRRVCTKLNDHQHKILVCSSVKSSLVPFVSIKVRKDSTLSRQR
jgi:hypothetical protein